MSDVWYIFPMGHLGEMLRDYRAWYAGDGPVPAGWRRGILPWMLGAMLAAALLSLLFSWGYFSGFLHEHFTQLYHSFAEAFRHLIPLIGTVAWLLLALGNLKRADPDARQPASRCFLLALHSGAWPLLCMLLCQGGLLLLTLALSTHWTSPTWLSENYRWEYIVGEQQRYLRLDFNMLPSTLLHAALLTALSLAVAIQNRHIRVVWLVCGLLNSQLLFELAAPFHHPNIYAFYWLDYVGRPPLLLFIYTAGALAVLHLSDSDQGFLIGAGSIAALRIADLYFSFGRLGSFTAVQYDDAVKPLANIVWHLNIPFRYPLLGCQPAEYNPAFGFTHILSGDYRLALLDQFQGGLTTGMEGYLLATVGNALLFLLGLLACLHTIHGRHAKQQESA